MKISFVLLSFLFLAFVSKPLLGSRAETEPLLDINGEKVLSGTPYYIMSAIIGAGGGGLSLASGANLCPLNVIQQASDLNKGQPLIFSPAVENGDGIVYESNDLNIKFARAGSYCFQPTVWKVDDYDKSTGKWFITTNGVEGNPGAATLLNWFKFEKVGSLNAYKIVHCPKVCDTCVTLCYPIGIYGVNGQRRLALEVESSIFSVVFIKADEYNQHYDNRKIISMIK